MSRQVKKSVEKDWHEKSRGCTGCQINQAVGRTCETQNVDTSPLLGRNL